jgi:hypothetical protein
VKLSDWYFVRLRDWYFVRLSEWYFVKLGDWYFVRLSEWYFVKLGDCYFVKHFSFINVGLAEDCERPWRRASGLDFTACGTWFNPCCGQFGSRQDCVRFYSGMRRSPSESNGKLLTFYA